MTFKLKIFLSRKILYLVKFDETPRYRYPRITCDAWINFSSWTVELRPLKRRENLPFLFSLFFFSARFLPSLSFVFLQFFFSFGLIPHRILFLLFLSPPISFSFYSLSIIPIFFLNFSFFILHLTLGSM